MCTSKNGMVKLTQSVVLQVQIVDGVSTMVKAIPETDTTKVSSV
jgi:hypothetical protein